MTSKQLTRNFLFLFLSNVIGQVLALAALVHLARVLGPEGFGRFSFAQVISLYFLYLADFGLQTLGTREVARNRDVVPQLVRTISLMRAITASVSFVLLVMFVLLLGRTAAEKHLIMVFGLSILSSAVLLEWVFQGLERMEIVAIGRVLRGFVFAALVFGLVASGEHVVQAAAYYVAGIVAATIALFVFYRRQFPASGSGLQLQALRPLFIAALPLAIGSLVTQVNYNFGTFALGLYRPDYDVGLFSSAYKIILFLWAFVVVAASNAILPMLVRAYSTGEGDLSAEVARLVRWFTIAAVPVGVGGMVLADALMQFLYPPAYASAGNVLRSGIWIVSIVMIRVVFENVLLAGKNEEAYLRGYVAAGVLNVAGNIALVPQLGLLAPIIVSLVSELGLCVYFIAKSDVMEGKQFFNLIAGPVGASVIMGLMLELLPFHILALIPVGGAVYVTSLILFRVVSVEELLRHALSFVRLHR